MKRPASAETDLELSIDGSQGEGGGQILRNAISYACILQRSLHIHQIRAKRSKPGLKRQHLTGLQLCAKIGGGTLEGDALHSTEITYRPPPPLSLPASSQATPVFTGAIDSAGSICLLLQAALPCVLFRRGCEQTRLILKGGTNADLAPQYDYWERVFLPVFLQCFQLPPGIISPHMITRGYFPKGGGHVELGVTSLTHPLPAFQLTDRGTLQHISIRSFHAGKLPKHMATQMADAAKAHLRQELNLDNVAVETEIVMETNAVGSGTGILLVATTSTGCRLGGSTICKHKQKPKEAGLAAAQELVKALREGGCVDEWLQDQLIIYMALAQGTSQMLTGCLTLHTRTAMDVARQLIPGVQFEVQKITGGDGNPTQTSDKYGKDGLIHGQHLITCQGLGLTTDDIGAAA